IGLVGHRKAEQVPVELAACLDLGDIEPEMAETADLERPFEQNAADIVTLTIGGHGSFLLGSGPLRRGCAVPIMRFPRRKDKPPVAGSKPGRHTSSRRRKIRCTTRIKVPMMTICRDDAAAIVGSPCHWSCENRWTG